MRVLVAGAGGYVGSRLVPLLAAAGHDVHCLEPDPQLLDGRSWPDGVHIERGDVLEPRSLKEAATGCDVAYYLKEATSPDSVAPDSDLRGAVNLREPAAEAGLRRIVYLGSSHNRGRRQAADPRAGDAVGRDLADGPTPVTELRVSEIAGTGSPSFEMLRHLTEVLPVMAAPRWLRERCRPIAVDDLLALLVAAAGEPYSEVSVVLDVGGPEELTYEDMVRIYAEEAGLRKRRIIPMPVHIRGLSSLWVAAVTPLPRDVARRLIENRRPQPAVQHERPPLRSVQPTPYGEAVRRALGRDGGPPRAPSDHVPVSAIAAAGDPMWSGGRVMIDRRVVPTDADPSHVYWAFSRIGGKVGYYGLNWAWRGGALLDRVIGGVGFRHGRRDPDALYVGEAVDFWRVEALEPQRLLRLCAEMRLPGEARLEWLIVPTAQGSDLIQTAHFKPRGIAGRIYWAAMWPFHRVIFPRMACAIAAAAEERGYSCS